MICNKCDKPVTLKEKHLVFQLNEDNEVKKKEFYHWDCWNKYFKEKIADQSEKHLKVFKNALKIGKPVIKELLK